MPDPPMPAKSTSEWVPIAGGSMSADHLNWSPSERIWDSMSVIFTSFVVFQQHHRDAVPHRIRPAAPRAYEAGSGNVLFERPVVRRADEDLGEDRIYQAHASPRMARTRSTMSATRSASGPSTLSRSNGSVLEGRRLNQASPWSSVHPSRRSVDAGLACASSSSRLAASVSVTSQLISPEAA